MPATLGRRPATGPPASDLEAPTHSSPADRLRDHYAAVRVSFTWLGVRKTLSTEQRAQAAEGFGAEGDYLSAAKKLLDTRHPAYQQVTSLRSQILGYWRGLSLPYPEPGVRLIRQQDVAAFDARLVEFRSELAKAVAALDEQLTDLKADARRRLGRLYNPADYPDSLRGLFAVEWDWPAVEAAPAYLRRLSPHLYEQERQRIAARFDEAVKLAEEAFTTEFAKLIGHLVERLTAGPDGQKKVFRDSAVTNLRTFFDRFRTLSVSSNPELDQLVQTAQQLLDGKDPQAVRENQALRQQVTSQLSAVQSVLDGMLVDQPRRRILRQGGTARGTKAGEKEAAP